MMSLDPMASPKISVILPVHNGDRYLARTIPAIRASAYENFELLVVDDASSDGTRDLLTRFPADVLIENAAQLGPFASRNIGARRASGDIFFFTDADVLLQPDTLARVAQRLAEPGAGAVIGLYSAADSADNLWMFYKTTWIRFSYLQAPEQVSWFFTAVGGLRRETWEKCGSFHTQFSIRTGGGDIDYGRRLVAQGTTIQLDRELEVRHLKHFTLRSLLRNDLQRAFGYSRLGLQAWRQRQVAGAAPPRGIANVGGSFVGGVISASLLLVAFVMGAPALLRWGLCLSWFGVNRSFLGYVLQETRLVRVPLLVTVLYVDQLTCALGVAGAVASELVRIVWPRGTEAVK